MPLTAVVGQVVQANLRILATSDVHMHLLDYDYYADRTCDLTGLTRTAVLIEHARAEAPNCLLFDNGDFLQGNPLGDFVAQSGTSKGGHPVIRAMNALGYDAGTLGNHEFNYGLDFLTRSIADAAFPLVSANIVRRLGARPDADETLLPPYVLLDRRISDDDGNDHAIRIGVVGFAPPQILQWDRLHLEGRLQTRGIIEAARAFVPRMKAEGAEIIVALSHSGIGAADVERHEEYASTALARIEGIDAIIAGHSHLVFPSPAFAGLRGVEPESGTLCGKPAVMPGFHGSHLGVIDLTLRKSRAGWEVMRHAVEARAIGAIPATSPRRSEQVVRTVGPDHIATLAHSRRPAGKSRLPLNSFFATLTPSPALQIVAEAQAAHVAREVAGRPEAALPILSAVAPFKAGGRSGPGNYTAIPAGDLTLRHVADLYIYPNTIAALRLTGAELAEWLENSTGIYRQIRPGLPDQPLINPDFPSYLHDQIHGLSYEIDLSAPLAFGRNGRRLPSDPRRIRDLRWHGRPVAPEAEFLLATNSYRASGWGGFANKEASRVIDVGRTQVRDILLRHIEDVGTLLPGTAPAWRFAPMPGTTVLFDTSPDAAAHLGAIAHFRPKPLGLTPEGFARFRLHL